MSVCEVHNEREALKFAVFSARRRMREMAKEYRSLRKTCFAIQFLGWAVAFRNLAELYAQIERQVNV